MGRLILILLAALVVFLLVSALISALHFLLVSALISALHFLFWVALVALAVVAVLRLGSGMRRSRR